MPSLRFWPGKGVAGVGRAVLAGQEHSCFLLLLCHGSGPWQADASHSSGRKLFTYFWLG